MYVGSVKVPVWQSGFVFCTRWKGELDSLCTSDDGQGWGERLSGRKRTIRLIRICHVYSKKQAAYRVFMLGIPRKDKMQ